MVFITKVYYFDANPCYKDCVPDSRFVFQIADIVLQELLLSQIEEAL